MNGKEIDDKEICSLLRGALGIINEYERMTERFPQVGFEWHSLNERVKLYRKYVIDTFIPKPDKE